MRVQLCTHARTLVNTSTLHVHLTVYTCIAQIMLTFMFTCAGEKLSKQELQSNSIIKKLRQKDKQNDQLLAAQRYTLIDICSNLQCT